MIPLLAASAAVLLVAILAAHALPLRGAVERAVATLLVGQAVITATLLVAGLVLRNFSPATLVALALVELAGITVAMRPSGLRVAVGSLRASLRTSFAGLREAFTRPPVLGVCVVAAVCLAWRAFVALRLGVLDYDAFSYHLVTVDMWLQQDAIERIPQRIWSDIYPANGELVTLWLMAFTRNDGLAAFTGLLSVPLASVSTVGLARVLGANRAWALLAGALLAITPALIVLTSTTYVDILAAADLGAGWYLGILALRERQGHRRSALLLLAGIAIGLAIGTKQTVLLPATAFGAVLAGAVLARWFVGRRAGSNRSPGPAGDPARGAIPAVAYDLAAVSIPALAFGSYWYLRNLLAYGNPFWPFSVGPFAGVGTFAEYLAGSALGMEGSPLSLLVRSWTADFGITRYTFDQRLGGFGLQWLPLLAAAVIGLVALITRRAHPLGRRVPATSVGRRTRLLGAASIVLPAAAALAVTPMSWWARLTLYVVIAVLALAAVGLTRLPRTAAVVVAIVVAAGATWSVGIATATNNLPTDASYRIVSFQRLARLALRDATTRRHLAFWQQCSDFERIPRGSRVTFDQSDLRRVSEGGRYRLVGSGFNLLHLLVGHRLERTLAPPIEPTDDPAVLLERARAVGAAYVVLVKDGPTAAAARRAPEKFRSLGVACDGPLAIVETEIFEVMAAA